MEENFETRVAELVQAATSFAQSERVNKLELELAAVNARISVLSTGDKSIQKSAEKAKEDRKKFEEHFLERFRAIATLKQETTKASEELGEKQGLVAEVRKLKEIIKEKDDAIEKLRKRAEKLEGQFGEAFWNNSDALEKLDGLSETADVAKGWVEHVYDTTDDAMGMSKTTLRRC